MRITVDHKLRIDQSELPSDVRDLIVQALSIPNFEKEKARDMDVWGWRSMPDFIPLWETLYDPMRKRETLIMPRGFLPGLIRGLQMLGIDFQITDNTLFEGSPGHGAGIQLRPWQQLALQAILNEKTGIWKAPAGSGKTVGVLAAIGQLNCPSIVLVNTLDILWQWRQRARQFLGEDFPVGFIGDGMFEISDYLTIATAQTLHSRFGDLEASGFFDNQFSFVCLDECHHATAVTYLRILNRFTARYRIGVSATPDKTGDFRLATNTLGPIFHETKRESVTNLIKPTIFRIPTGFAYPYFDRRDYHTMIKALISDATRLSLIVATIMLNKHRHQLVCSQRLEHLHLIAQVLSGIGYPHAVHSLIGSAESNERQRIIENAGKAPCVILSTLADEALDIPRLDGVHLAFPHKNTGLIAQQIGRGAREAPGKVDFHVFDYCDAVKPMEYQWQARRNEIYLPSKYQVVTVLPNEIMRAYREQEN